MSKRFHDIRNTKKMLQYGTDNSIGPFRQKPQRRDYPVINSADENAIKSKTEE